MLGFFSEFGDYIFRYPSRLSIIEQYDARSFVMYKKNGGIFFLALILCFSLSTTFSYNSQKISSLTSVKAAEQQFSIKQRKPVVNEGRQILLNTIDSSGRMITDGVTWESGSPDIAQVNPTTGEVFGVKTGFATITARYKEGTSSVFVVVVKVRKINGSKIPGDTKADASGGIYISNPLQNVILKADDSTNSPVKVYAGRLGVAGYRSGDLAEALFAGPTAIGVDNSAKGGVYVTDTLNHSIRKIGLNQQVETILGTGSPGLNSFDSEAINFDQAALSSPRGVVTDSGGNLYIADTDNNAIYYADFSQRRLFLLAGDPGQKGKSDGIGRNARFNRPSGLALSNDGQLLVVADQDNNCVRLIEISHSQSGSIQGNVSTLSTSSITPGVAQEFEFDHPQSVALDGVSNIYVVDNKSVQLVVRPKGQNPTILPLAQPDVTFNQAVSVTIKGTDVFVLDSNVPEAEALSVVSVGQPEITSLEPAVINISESSEVIIHGKNFAPESQVIFNGTQVVNINVVSAEEIRFVAPKQPIPGQNTVSVLTRGGLSQQTLSAVSKPVRLLATGEITTLAGGKKFTGDGGQALQSSLNYPTKVVTDSNRNLFIALPAFQGLPGIRRIDAQTGIITTIAGGGNSLANGVLANTADLNPVSLALDSSGNLFVVDYHQPNYSIRRIDALTNIITTVAGGENSYFIGDGGPALNAGFDSVADIAFAPNGDLLVLESTRLRRIDKAGIITTIAGNGKNVFSGDNGPATAASFNGASALDVDSNGNIFIAEYFSGHVRQINTSGIITTVAGNGKKAKHSRNGKPAINIGLGSPSNIVTTNDGRILIVDFAHSKQTGDIFSLLSQVDLKTGIITTKPIKLPSDQNPLDLYITSINYVGSETLFFTTRNLVYRLNLTSGEAVLIAGTSKTNFKGDGMSAQTASTGNSINAVTDAQGNIYLADYPNGLVRKIDATSGIITTIVGADTSKTVGNGDRGLALNARVTPYALAIDKQGNLLIADVGSAFLAVGSRVRKVDMVTGIITTIAGTGKEDKTSGDNGPALSADIEFLFNIVTDSQNNIYINGYGGLRRIDAKTGVITTIAHPQVAPGSTLAIDRSDRILIAMDANINLLDPITGKQTLFGGNGKLEFSGDGGLLKDAGLGHPTGLAFDGAGNLFIQGETTDKGINNLSIRRVDAKTGIITTIAQGQAQGNNNSYSGDGGAASQAKLVAFSSRITVDAQGNLYIVSFSDAINSVRVVKLAQ